MPEEKEQELLTLFYGSHPKAIKYLFPKGKVLLEAFGKKQFYTRVELSGLLGLDLTDSLKESNLKQWLANRSKFYSALGPLTGKNRLGVKLIVSDRKQQGYFVDFQVASATITHLIKNLSYRFSKWDSRGTGEEDDL